MKKFFYTLAGLGGLFLIWQIIEALYRLLSYPAAEEHPVRLGIAAVIFALLLSAGLILWFNRKKIREKRRLAREKRAALKREKIEKLRQTVHAEIEKNKVGLGESLALGAGASALTLFDVYAAMQESGALESVSLSAEDGAGAVLEAADGAAGIGETAGELAETVASGAAEELAENAAGELAENAAEELAESAAGEVAESAAEELAENAAGELAETAAQEAEALAETAENAAAAADHAIDYIPMISLILLGRRVYKNTKELNEGKQTKHEWKINTLGDAARIGAKTLTAKAGASLGGSIGSMAAPGIGTVIGAGIGAMSGAMASGLAIQTVKDKVKWGKIINAQEQIGENFELHSQDLSKNITVVFLCSPEIEKRIEEQEMTLKHYEQELDPYSRTPATLQAVAASEYYQALLREADRIEFIRLNLPEQMEKTCEEIAANTRPGLLGTTEQVKNRMLGELLINNREMVPVWSSKETALLTDYDEQKARADHYPYRFGMKNDEVIRALIDRTAGEYKTPGERQEEASVSYKEIET